MKKRKPLVVTIVLGAMIATIVGLIVGLIVISRDSVRRDRAEATLAYSAFSDQSEGDLWMCLSDGRIHGLAFNRRGAVALFDESQRLINAARHTSLAIDNLGDKRLVRVWIRRDLKLRPGEIEHLRACAI